MARPVGGGKYTTIDMKGVNGMLQNLGPITQAAAHKMAQELSLIGELEMKRIIDTKSSGFGRKRMKKNIGNSKGRNRSGQMLNAVTSRTSGPGGKVVRSAWGWLKKPEPYYSYQDKGFNEWYKILYFNEVAHEFVFEKLRSSHWKKGIFSVRDSRKKVVNELPKIIAGIEMFIVKEARKGKTHL
jgi:hypothetical protein